MEQLCPSHKWNLAFEASYSTNLGLWLIYSAKWCCCNSSQGKLKDFRIWTTCWNSVSFLRHRAWNQSSALYRDRKDGIWQNVWRSDKETPLHHENWDPATQHRISKITLKAVPDATHNHNTECLQWEADGSLPKPRYVFFIWEGNFLSNNIIRSDSDFPPGKHPEHISMWRRTASPRAWDRRGTKEGSTSTAGTRHQDVLLLEPKPFGFSTTIFSIWFLAGIRKKKKKFVFIRSPSGKAPHPIPALPAGQASRNMALSLWIFISLGYWGRHLMRLLTETEKFWGKATTSKQSGMFSSHGRGQYFSFIEVFWQGCLLSKKGDFQVCSSALGEAAPSHSCLSYSWDFSVTKVTKSPARHSRALNLVPHRVQVVTTCASIPAEILLILWGKWKYMTAPALFCIWAFSVLYPNLNFLLGSKVLPM